MPIKKLLAATGLLLLAATASAQNIEYARAVVSTLASPELHGRGYVLNGHKLAATYIANEYETIGLKHFGDSYFQPFQLDVNTFPAEMELLVDGQPLKAGADFIALGHSGSAHETFDVVMFNARLASNEKKVRDLVNSDLSNTVIVADSRGIEDTEIKQLVDAMRWNPLKAAGVIVLEEKLTATYSQEAASYPALGVLVDAWPKKAKKVTINVKHQFRKNITTNNVVGFVPGTTQPDSFLVFTAHYDHLGRMGADHYIPGANDNASGTAMLLNLAKYYQENPPKYSVVFFATAGEEVGLLGSKHFVANPLVDLTKIKFLLNFDILGTGDEGIKVVNATIFKERFERLKAINAEHDWLPSVQPRGAMNRSDHAPFYELGVPCFYFYTLGGVKHYHDVYDKAETLPLTEFEDLFRLVTAFMDEQ